jgi:4'-phosphopantetheinyl transferase
MRVLIALARDADVPAGVAWLSAAEAARLATMRVPKRARDFRLGRWTARVALGAWGNGSSGADVEVVAAADGAPEAHASGRPLPCVVSISHAAGWGACAVARAGAALGCDVEAIEPRDAAFVEDFFTPGEREAFGAARDGDRDLLVALVWSAKESALKAMREGLRRDTRSVEVSVPEATDVGGWRPLRVRSADDGRAFDGWWRAEGPLVITVVSDPPPAPPRLVAAGDR